jgi:catechol-2,3-dioxygenase
MQFRLLRYLVTAQQGFSRRVNMYLTSSKSPGRNSRAKSSASGLPRPSSGLSGIAMCFSSSSTSSGSSSFASGGLNRIQERGRPLSHRLPDADAKDLARWLVHVALNRVPLSGFADHRDSESVYLDDPEGNGVEVYADRDPSLWQWSDGSVTMATDNLDIDDLVTLTDTRVSDYAKAPGGLRIGHVHLRVGDLARAESFYHGIIGLDPTRRRNGASFLSSGRYHHLGMNVWQSAGAGRRDETATGLVWFSLEVAKPDMFAAQQERFRQAGAQVAALAEGIETVDPWGTRVRLVKV